jgi:hypothetical protein
MVLRPPASGLRMPGPARTAGHGGWGAGHYRVAADQPLRGRAVLQGWYDDPFRLHEARYFSGGRPTNLVRDGDKDSYDEPPSCASGNLLEGSTATQDQEPPGWPGQQPPIWLPDGDYRPDLGADQRRQAPPPRRHRTRNILFSSIAGLPVLLVGAGIWAAASGTRHPSLSTARRWPRAIATTARGSGRRGTSSRTWLAAVHRADPTIASRSLMNSAPVAARPPPSTLRSREVPITWKSTRSVPGASR